MKDPRIPRLRPRLFALGLALGGTCAVLQAQAPVEINIDFNSDPIAAGVFSFVSTEPTPWRATGGVGDSGYLAITDARGGQNSHIAFKDYTPGLVVKAFTFECDLRIGGGTERPADGFSLNFVSAEDPIVSDIESGINPTGSRYSGTDNETSLPEEGSRTGLGIGFDTWQSATINGIQDVVGISVRVNGELKFQLPVPLEPGNIFPGGTSDEVPYRNLPVGDANYKKSMQTGALTDEDLNFDGVVDANDWGTPQPEYFDGDTEWPKWIKNLTWEHFKAEVTETGRVKIWWKDVELTPEGGLETGFAPIPGRIVFGGRTGGAWEVHHVDNIHMTLIPADNILVGNATGTPIGFTISVIDSGPAIVDPNTAQITLDGNPVTPTSVTKDAGITKFTYMDPANPMAAGSTHTVAITVSDTRGIEVSDTREFTVPDYISLPPEFAVQGASDPGFDLDLYYLDHNVGNSVARAERQLHGDLGENFAIDEFFQRTDHAVIDTVINLSQDNGDAFTPEAAGVFTEANGKPDMLIPGLNYAELTDPLWRDNLAIRIKTVLHFPKQGIYTLIFNSDDGFRTIAHKNYREQLNSLILSQFDGGRGASDSAVTLYIAEPGYYPVSTVWFEGQGGANLEWSAITMDSNGQRLLINDTEPGALKAYRTISDPKIPSAVSFVDPVRDSGNPYSPMQTIRADILNGTSPVNVGTIKLLVNDVQVAATVSGTSTGATVSYTPAQPYPSGSTVKVTIQFQEQDGTPYEGSYTFNVRDYTTLPSSLSVSQADVGPRGFLIRTVQSAQGRGNSRDEADFQLAGGMGDNIADPADFDTDGWMRETTTINYSQVAGESNGNFPDDRKMPGIPGTTGSTDNFALEILTILRFPSAGFYWLGFNSDDGFHVTAGDPRDRLAPLLGIFNGGRGASDTWFVVNVPQPGYYPIRIGYYEGGGGANCEFFSLTPPDLEGNVTRTLVNDTGGIEAYQPKLDANGNPILTPYIKAFGPGRNGANAPLTGTVHVWIEDGATAAGPITMKYDGVEVTPTITKDGTTTHVMYKPDALLAEGQTVPVELTIGDRVASWSFTTETGDPPTGDVAFFIEAEDFNYNGGQSKPEASVMPYLGGAYSGLGAVSPTDYDRASQGDSPLYRIGEDPQVPMDRSGDNDRGLVEVQLNLKIGWIAEGQTYVYTRNFPAGEYNVWAGLSHGDAPDSGTMVSGSLQLLSGGTATDLGTFSAPATGGWGNNDLVPLKDANGQMVTVALGGTQTVQFTAGNGDFDYLLFTLPGAQVQAPRFTNIQKNPDGSITIEWTGNAVLESAPTLQGPWTEVPGATSPFTFAPDPAQPVLFGRLRAQ